LDSTGSGQGPVADCCECDDEPSGSCATELVMYKFIGLGIYQYFFSLSKLYFIFKQNLLKRAQLKYL
jgi:hypothetical protein